MAPRVVVTVNPALERSLLASPEVARWLAVIVNAGAEAAKRRAPRRKGFLVGSIEGEVVTGGEHPIVGLIKSGDFKSWWHEAGTKRMDATPFLVPAALEVAPGANLTRTRP